MFFVIAFLGILQGLTEFLPVSSSGHLVLFEKIFNIQDGLFVSVILHFATLFSVVFVLRKKLWEIFKNPFSKDTLKLILSTFVSCLVVLLILPLVEFAYGGSWLAVCFLITATILLFTDFLFINKNCNKALPKKNNNAGLFEGIGFKQAVLMGLFQGFAIFPGISRSGFTICAGVIGGSDKSDVAEYSFIMSLPIILISVFKEIFEIVKFDKVLQIDILALIISFVLAFVVGVFALKLMINITKKVNFRWFSVYLVLLSIFSFFIL